MSGKSKSKKNYIRKANPMERSYNTYLVLFRKVMEKDEKFKKLLDNLENKNNKFNDG
ncbi:MAG: hypothetical protein ACFFAO_13540 [Candidatus Hermodarchaeota archaeon]